MKVYIHEKDDWGNFIWDNEKVLLKLGETRNRQGRLLGKMESLGFNLQNKTTLSTLTLDILKSSEIEGQYLDKEQVRSSVARRLGIEIAGTKASERDVDGVVEMMLDATQNYDTQLTEERLFNWHAALFLTGRSGMYKITVADWRKGDEPMRVISGAMGKEKIHYVAPCSERVPGEMKRFLEWFNHNNNLDLVLKAAIAHLWFISIHPFDDGNGRMARTIADMLLARSDKSIKRFYSMSAQIETEKENYYSVLEKSQKGNSDITNWILWFLNCLSDAIESSNNLLSKVLYRDDFWKIHSSTVLNERQHKIINKLLDNFEGKLTSSKWAKMNKCSQDTAIRDIQSLIEKEILMKDTKGGRSTSYLLK